LQREVAAVLATRSRAEWAAKLDAAGIPWGPVNALDEVTADPHFRARGLFREVADSDGTHRRHVAQPLIFSGEHPGPRSGVPALGEHTEQVLRALPELKTS
jgi:crotonobetainyl-CoA:carnitine CoA-transferase CaiB-like acyl-CoA transferase